MKLLYKLFFPKYCIVTSYFDRKPSCCCWLLMLLKCMLKNKTFRNEINPRPQIFYSDALKSVFVLRVYSNSLNCRNFGCKRPIRFRWNSIMRQRRKLNLSSWRASFRSCLQIRHALCLNYDRHFHWYVRQFRNSSFTSIMCIYFPNGTTTVKTPVDAVEKT